MSINTCACQFEESNYIVGQFGLYSIVLLGSVIYICVGFSHYVLSNVEKLISNKSPGYNINISESSNNCINFSTGAATATSNNASTVNSNDSNNRGCDSNNTGAGYETNSESGCEKFICGDCIQELAREKIRQDGCGTDGSESEQCDCDVCVEARENFICDECAQALEEEDICVELEGDEEGEEEEGDGEEGDGDEEEEGEEEEDYADDQNDPDYVPDEDEDEDDGDEDDGDEEDEAKESIPEIPISQVDKIDDDYVPVRHSE